MSLIAVSCGVINFPLIFIRGGNPPKSSTGPLTPAQLGATIVHENETAAGAHSEFVLLGAATRQARPLQKHGTMRKLGQETRRNGGTTSSLNPTRYTTESRPRVGGGKNYDI